MLTLLRNRNFFWLWLGQAISLVGDEVRDWAMIFWIFEASGRSPVVQSLSFIAVMAPGLLLGPFAGVLVDRWDRRRVMIVADIVRGGIALLLIPALATGQYWYALGITFLGACVAPFFTPARGAMIPRVVPREQLLQANSLSQTTNTIMQLAGPALGIAVYRLLGAGGSISFDAVTFVLSALCITLVTTSGAMAATGRRPDFMGELKGGLAYAWGNGPVRTMIIAFTVLFVGAGATNSLGIFIVRQMLGLSEAALVLPAIAAPLATGIAALTIGTAARKLRRAPLLVAFALFLAAAGIGMQAGAPTLAWVVAGAVVVGVCNAMLNIGVSTTLQMFVPDEYRGRVFGALNSLPTAAMLASAGAAGYLAQVVNPRLVLGASALFPLLAGLLAFAGLRNVLLPETAPAAVPIPAPAAVPGAAAETAS